MKKAFKSKIGKWCMVKGLHCIQSDQGPYLDDYICVIYGVRKGKYLIRFPGNSDIFEVDPNRIAIRELYYAK